MYGVVTRNENELSWEEFDTAFFEMKDVTGRANEPVTDGSNMLSCFGDNAAVESDPSLAAVGEDGELATRERTYFDWDYVCPTNEAYREGLLEMVEDAAEINDDLRIDDVGFPRAEYCHCERCNRLFAESEFEDRARWRQHVVTEFVREVRERVPGTLYMTLYPDPYPGHLETRRGVDVDELSRYVDEFVVTLYDTAYGTTYWLEILASSFRDRLDVPFGVELYAIDVEMGNLVHAAEVVEAYADTVLFGYHAGNGRGAIRRMRAKRGDGDSYGPGDGGQ